MAAEIPSSCRPDKYLTQSQLQELYNDFTSSIASSRPVASTFASLVNSVRLAYKDPLYEAIEELQTQAKEHARELAVLRAEKAEGVGAILRERPAAESGSSAEVWIEDQVCTANSFPLYIFSATSNCRRDWATWVATMSEEDHEFEERMSFKVFKFQEPGLIEIVLYRKYKPDRMMAVRANQDTSWWTDQSWWRVSYSFWAYGNPGPERERIWVGWHGYPERGIFMRGGKEGMEPWEEKCEFWVPI